MKWENAYVFISSTFNDMHAERDFLVKRVFPDLRLWCQERKIKLIDIDLRWGVSEEDAAENKKVVDICLKNIDKQGENMRKNIQFINLLYKNNKS